MSVHYCPPVASPVPVWPAGDGPGGGARGRGSLAQAALGVNKELTCKCKGRKRAEPEGVSLRSQVRRSSDLIGGLSIKLAPGAEALNKENKDG